MCRAMPLACAKSAIARTSSGWYSVPSSVVWVMLTAAGCARCSSSKPNASVSISSGVSLPSGVGTTNSLMPAIFSGAPPSSVWMCAVRVAMAAPHRGSRADERDDVGAGAVEHRVRLRARRRSARARRAGDGRCRRPRRRRSGGRRSRPRSRRALRDARRRSCRSRSRAARDRGGSQVSFSQPVSASAPRASAPAAPV